ncbi:MAG: GNAT family protein [bacterium]
MHNPFLEGKAVYLRALEADDAGQFAQWLESPGAYEVRKRHPFVAQMANRIFLDRLYDLPVENIYWGVASPRDHRLLGVAGLGQLDQLNRHAEMLLFFAEDRLWQGTPARETLDLVIGYAFGTLNLHRLGLNVPATCAAERRSYEDAGFVLEVTLREQLLLETGYADLCHYGLLNPKHGSG